MLNSETSNGVKLAAVSVVTSLGSIPLEDVTQVGQVCSILVGIISGVVSLIKLFKRKK